MATLGTTLRAARQAKNVTASQAAAATRIKMQTIEMLENDDFSHMAAPIYGKGFIRLYAEYLGLDPVPLVEEYMAKSGPSQVPSLKSDPSGTLKHPESPVEDPESAGDRPDDAPAEPGHRQLDHQAAAGRQPAPPAAIAVADPWKLVWIALGVVVVLLSLVAGVSRCARHSRLAPVVNRHGGAAADLARELPPPYLETTR